MLKIRLQRTGRKNYTAYSVVVAENSDPINGKFIEKLGSFIASKRDDTLKLNLDRISYWISVGAQVSDVVARMLVKNGLKNADKFVKKRIMKPKKPLEEKTVAKDTVKEESSTTSESNDGDSAKAEDSAVSA